MQFNDSSIVTSYIKQLLKDFNLPQCEVWKPGIRVYKNCFYINNNQLLRAKQTGEFNEITTTNFKTVYDDYVFGSYIYSLTKNLKVDNLIYDSYTHEYLGNYLRFLRDYKDLDLMSMYNCFSNRTISDISIANGIEQTNIVWTQKESGDYEKHIEITYSDFNNNNGSKVYMVNILPFKEYTIYIDSKEPVEMIACYYDNGLLDLKFGEAKAISFPYSKTYMKQLNTSFNKPFIYDKMSSDNMSKEEWLAVKDPLAYNHRQQLKLLIKVNASNNSSLVVLEGNYLENNKQHFDNKGLALVDKIQSIPYDGSTYNQNIKRDYLSKLGLTKIQTNSQYPFSNRLIEYLFNNAITPIDTIDNNISRVQQIFKHRVKVGADEYVELKRVRLNGVWDNSIRNCAYAVAKKKNLINTKYDVIGYIDKDIESAIGLEDEE